MKPILVGIGLILFMISMVACTTNSYEKEREELAEYLEVDISEYKISNFPASYFVTVLQPGTPIDKVHAIITGYSKAYFCGDYEEIYYYFNEEDSKAFRFMVFYDDETLTFQSIQGEDSDSRYISIKDCGEGLLQNRIPLIDPIEVNRLNSSSSWDIELQPCMWFNFPNSQGLYYLYGHIHSPEKFAVENGVIMAYSSYVDKDADAYIQDNFFHWFVMVPDEKITKGFQTEDAFLEYIQTLGVEDPDWQTPDEAFDTFLETGCLAWIPDCE